MLSVLWTPSSPAFSWAPTIIYFTVSWVCKLYIYTGYSSSVWRHAQGSHVLKNIFLHPEGCLPVGTKFSLPFQPHFFPQVSWTTSIISLCRPSSAPEIPCTAPRSQQRPWELSLTVLRFYLPWSLRSFETVDTTFLFISLKLQSLHPPLLWSLLLRLLGRL